MTRVRRRWAIMVLLLAGCGTDRAAAPEPAPKVVPSIGYQPAPGARAASGLPCRDGVRARHWLHLELFRRGRIVVIPAGLGIAPPRRRDGAYVTGGRCRFPLFTEEPTGLVGVARPGLTLRDLFAVWGRPLREVTVHVDGRRWTGDPGAVPLRRHAQVVVQETTPPAPPVPVNSDYRFPPGY